MALHFYSGVPFFAVAEMSDHPIACDQQDLDNVMLKHAVDLSNFGVYENLSKAMAVNGKGLVGLNDFLTSLLKLAPWANLMQSQIKDAILTTNSSKMINKGPLTDRNWAIQRTERVIMLLAHLRRIKTQYRFDQCATKMQKGDIRTLAELLSLIDTISYQESDAASSGGATKRVLEAHPSNTSALTVDSDGYPAILSSPKKAKLKSTYASVDVPEQTVEEEKEGDLLTELCLKRPASFSMSSMKKVVHKKPACAALLCPDFPRRLEAPKGMLKLTFATGQSYIHFTDNKEATTFLVSRAAKSSPDHHAQILNLAQKLAKLKHETGKQMKEAALKMKPW